MERVGLGKILLELTLDGIRDEDKDHIRNVEVQIKEPDGKIWKTQALYDRENNVIKFIHIATKKGTHKVSAKINFDDDYFITSIEPFVFYVSSDWEDEI